MILDTALYVSAFGCTGASALFFNGARLSRRHGDRDGFDLGFAFGGLA
ncbi:hypothetical protein SAMN04490244_101287 [Tranquillimonas rosea]|uniref:Uncharacterized protein n=1 Tax=Tranquillimonas rosea TaxID=641238 RepID=A0A1H9PQ90_9RHOB|nr:hypothetical protein [Tranquillimonas rosea]SER50402.1 hypothetical protein SAMN04490244_101287 [Tranquillimonas rosea]